MLVCAKSLNRSKRTLKERRDPGGHSASGQPIGNTEGAVGPRLNEGETAGVPVTDLGATAVFPWCRPATPIFSKSSSVNSGRTEIVNAVFNKAIRVLGHAELLRTRYLVRLWRTHDDNSSSNAFVSLRSRVSKIAGA
jgi:hypothetical protein